MKAYPEPSNFSGAKFAARYNLDPLRMDFWSDGKFLYVPDNLPDDPPIFEPPDPIVPAPTGIWVHEMKALTKKQGSVLMDGQGTSCYRIIVENELTLDDPWLAGVFIDIGSTAYIMDKAKTVVWDGTKWK